MPLCKIAIALFVVAASAAAQTPITVSLTPAAPSPGHALRWSPYGATIALQPEGKTLLGKFPLGPDGSPLIQVKLANVGDSAHFNTLWVDTNRDGVFGDAEKFTATPKIQNFKWWSSFGPVTVSVPVPAEDGKPATTRPYTLNLWYVFDPAEEIGMKPVMRWSRSGWHAGEVEIGGKPAYVIVTEWEQDGKFDQRDAWAISRDSTKALTASSKKMETHIWLDSVAYLPVSIDPSGRSISFAVIHPKTTEAEELAKLDIYAPDSLAPKAAKPVAFSKELPAVLAQAAKEKKRVLVTFDAVWCGPCHVMDRFVYTSVAVVDATKDIVAAKIDGDERPDLKKRYNVGAFPTVILLDSTGKEIRRAVGYQSVADMVTFLK